MIVGVIIVAAVFAANWLQSSRFLMRAYQRTDEALKLAKEWKYIAERRELLCDEWRAIAARYERLAKDGRP